MLFGVLDACDSNFRQGNIDSGGGEDHLELVEAGLLSLSCFLCFLNIFCGLL